MQRPNLWRVKEFQVVLWNLLADQFGQSGFVQLVQQRVVWLGRPSFYRLEGARSGERLPWGKVLVIHRLPEVTR